PQFDEPAGLSIAGGKLYVADTNNHAVRVIELKDGYKTSTLEIKGLKPPEAPPMVSPAVLAAEANEILIDPVTLKATDGKITLAVEITLPEGFKINPLAPMSYRVQPQKNSALFDAAGISKLVRVNPPSAKLNISVPLAAAAGEEEISVRMNYFYCQTEEKGVCKIGRANWKLSLTVADSGKASATLKVAAPE
ncbi:MAG: hypothetical protein N2C14_13165, partial [Planctomycetales bacterium]